MMTIRNYIYLVPPILLFFAFIFGGCSDNPTSPEIKTYTININVLDEDGEPVKGVQIITSPATVTHVTNQFGNVTMENITQGSYQVIVVHKDIPLFYKNINLSNTPHIDLKFVIATKVNLTVFVKNEKNELLEDVVIETIPATHKITTDKNGTGILKEIPFQEYTFVLSRSGHVAMIRTRRMQVSDGIAKDISFIIESQPPMMDIISPRGGKIDDIYDVHFVGDGFDFEDGFLPEENITWYSNIDDSLGSGSEIICDRLSVGHHVITLRGVDSDGNISEDKLGIDLYYYDEDSYFPIPKGAEWFYNYEITEFELVNADGETEHWTLQDLQTTMDDINARTSFMEYKIKNGNITHTAQYVVVDHFRTNEDSMYVHETEERLTLYYQRSPISNPTRKMNLHVEYQDLNEPGGGDYGYPLIKNHLDPASVPSFETSVSADITWKYEDEVFGSQLFSETLEINTNVDIGSPEPVQTDVGFFDNAVPITITQGESIRNWWLVKGIGLVKVQFNTFGFIQTAVLDQSNIETFQSQDLFGSGNSVTAAKSGHSVRKELSSIPGSADEMKEIRDFLHGLHPRQ